jgi:hypothetical protein
MNWLTLLALLGVKWLLLNLEPIGLFFEFEFELNMLCGLDVGLDVDADPLDIPLV